ncbi:hypothetical protein FH972_024388 [Carpinus fangiana]|uniref:Enoyl reductase (ER) domain-containing protein n=1 Tax=Carpinus fangiana TaxID=176857 RepID=A0A5N6KY99_9ROSI|nr:hypothetical protein FH972_024388 [Carpinus fangiana]
MSYLMKEAIVSSVDGKPSVELKDVPIPDPPSPTDVVIKVAVSGSNPKDWKYPEWTKQAANSGDDIAGTVHSVGSAVKTFHPGDRVMAFHVMRTPHGSFAEYAVAPAHTTVHLPDHTSFEEGAAIPLAALTAGVALFVRLGLPLPWAEGAVDGFASKDKDESASRSGFGVKGKPLQRAGPLIIYGAASAVGAYAIQLAKRAGIGPLICVAGKGIPFVEGLIDQKTGDVIVDYRKGDDAVVAAIKGAVGPGKEILYCFDGVSEHNSSENAAKAMGGKGAKITRVLPMVNDDGQFSTEDAWVIEGVETSKTMVADVHASQTDFGQALTSLLGKGLQEGWFKAHPQTVISGGLVGVQEGLTNLKEGKASATKYVFRIADTPGVGE